MLSSLDLQCSQQGSRLVNHQSPQSSILLVLITMPIQLTTSCHLSRRKGYFAWGGHADSCDHGFGRHESQRTIAVEAGDADVSGISVRSSCPNEIAITHVATMAERNRWLQQWQLCLILLFMRSCHLSQVCTTTMEPELLRTSFATDQVCAIFLHEECAHSMVLVGC